jgi:protein TonB
VFETIHTRRFTLSSGAVVSLLLHACLVPVLSRIMRSPSLRQTVMHELNVEVKGPRANRPIEAQQKRIFSPGSTGPAPEKPEPQQEKPKPAPTKAFRPDLTELKVAPSEVHNDAIDALHLPLPAAAPTEILHGGGAPSQIGNSEIEQKPQSAGHQSSEADLINAYISALARLVNSHLIYPKEVKKKRLEGVTSVSFVVTGSGEIKPDSLGIKRSSGYPELDANALKTIQSLAPFQRPPREMTISLEIEFAVDF